MLWPYVTQKSCVKPEACTSMSVDVDYGNHKSLESIYATRPATVNDLLCCSVEW